MVGQDFTDILLPEIKNYKTIRSFKEEPVDDNIINSILEAGRRAPSAKNRQPWRFVYIKDQGVKDRLQAAAYGQEHIGEASFVVAIGTTNVDYKMPNGQLSYPIDLSFAASFMIMQATSTGVGSCVVTTYNEAEVNEILTVPYKMRIVMLISFGYPKDEQPERLLERKPLNTITSQKHW
ncbi:MAG: nitroreductase family protein [Spirochaetales bacterium]|nr:nitroreductase family protein [Spirochaetales bacterium]